MGAFFQNLKRTVSLKEDEKARIRESLLKYLELNPVRNEEGPRRRMQRSETKITQLIDLFKLKTMPIIFSILLLISLGGASIAAEDAIPGDALYPIKVNFNEKIRTALVFNSESKGEFEIEKAERRIKEAKELAIKGLLSEENVGKIAHKFGAHAEKMSQISLKLEEQGDMEAAVNLRARLETMLNAHDDVIGQIKEGSITKERATDLLQDVKNEIVKISENTELKTKVENRIKSDITPVIKAAAEGKLGAAENKLAEAESFIAKNSDKLSAELKTKIAQRILEAKSAITEGKAKIEAGKYGEAFLLFQKSIRLSQQVKTMAKTHIELADDDSDNDNDNDTTTDNDANESDDHDDNGTTTDNDEDNEDEDDSEDPATSTESEEEEEEEEAKTRGGSVKSKGKLKIELEL